MQCFCCLSPVSVCLYLLVRLRCSLYLCAFCLSVFTAVLLLLFVSLSLLSSYVCCFVAHPVREEPHLGCLYTWKTQMASMPLLFCLDLDAREKTNSRTPPPSPPAAAGRL